MSIGEKSRCVNPIYHNQIMAVITHSTSRSIPSPSNLSSMSVSSALSKNRVTFNGQHGASHPLYGGQIRRQRRRDALVNSDWLHYLCSHLSVLQEHQITFKINSPDRFHYHRSAENKTQTSLLKACFSVSC